MRPPSTFENSRTQTPSRLLKKGKYGKHITHFPSFKNKKVVVCESELEADFCVWLEYEEQVVAYAPQPGTFTFVVDDRAVRYTPDFEITYGTGEIRYAEIKPDHIAEDTGYLRKVGEFRKVCELAGYGFDLITERDIRIQPKLRNLQNLYNRMHLVTDTELGYALDSLRQPSVSASTVRSLLALTYPPSMKSIAKAVFSGLMLADLDQPFTLDTRIVSAFAGAHDAYSYR
ncbi:Tn7 transposase TnsA N-terminal domain-containing protein [Pseudomonas sp. NPDC088368]|uniref:Tn7 transposase TnsA N-terminal domain-containing protein n=1 Tax=Pseudomonas sp. NPDC088368 TaxID=3364453 RepID=UPI00382B5317